VKFICDEMLKKLASWLRIAGHDVVVMPDGTSDRKIVDTARSEKRILLTRDRKIAEFKLDGVMVIIIECNDLESCIEALQHKIHINWLYKPFSRCNNCNALLVKATSEQSQQVPEQVRGLDTEFLWCSQCQQLFWEGSHVANMRKQLERWSRK